jgi:hypothetical protein
MPASALVMVLAAVKPRGRPLWGDGDGEPAPAPGACCDERPTLLSSLSSLPGDVCAALVLAARTRLVLLSASSSRLTEAL